MVHAAAQPRGSAALNGSPAEGRGRRLLQIHAAAVLIFGYGIAVLHGAVG